MNRITSILISAIMGLVLINGLAIATPTVKHALSTTTCKIYPGTDFLQVDFINHIIASNATATLNFSDIGSYDGLNFNLESVSSGSITTLPLRYLNSKGTLISTKNLTVGTFTTQHETGFLQVLIPNPVSGAAVTLNGVLLFSND